MDQSGVCFRLEADLHQVATMPRLSKPKLAPIILFIPSTDVDDLDCCGGSFFIMDTKLEAGLSEQSCLFEALLFRKRNKYVVSNSWHDCKPLLLPPYICDATCQNSCPVISSYAVVDGISQICVSVEGFGTYCMDITNYMWREEGKWTLPFHGKFEYVPELKLYFGFSKDRLFSTADLSTMGSPPQLLGTWKEFEPPEQWKEIQDPQFVNLGSGRFCVARFFHTTTDKGSLSDVDQTFTVLTGVEVGRSVHDGSAYCGNKKVNLLMHKSIYHKSNGIDIKAVL